LPREARRVRPAALVLAGVAASLAAAAPARAGAAEDEAAIRQRLHDWAAAFDARDPAGACDLFAPDLAYSLPDLPGGTRAGMCGNLAKVLARDDIRLRYGAPDIHEVIVSGDLAVVRLTWTPTSEAGGGAETTAEEGMDIFRRQPDGRWSIARFVAFTPDPQAGTP
jgi:ketosteroid isomerase-like protein